MIEKKNYHIVRTKSKQFVNYINVTFNSNIIQI